MSNKVYACSDLHGCYDLWAQMRDYCDADDRIIFLGDANDRGLHGIKIMQELLADARVTYLMGNHEDMFLDHATDWMELRRITDMHSIRVNGAIDTMNDFLKLNNDARTALLGSLRTLPTEIQYTNKNGQIIYLCHAGYTPNQVPQFQSDLEEYLFYLWDRSHIVQSWTGADNEFIVHGHTPVAYVIPGAKDIVTYCEGHKIDIDLGSAFSHRVALLDLNTLQPVYFTQRGV